MWRWLFEALINLLLTILVARTKSLGLQVEPLEHVHPEAPATRRAHQRERGNDFVEPKARLHTGAVVVYVFVSRNKTRHTGAVWATLSHTH